MQSDSRAGKRHRVFVVDDHPIVRRGLCGLIAEQPELEVCGESADVAGALSQLIASRPDVMVVDLSIRGGHGLELIREVRARSSHVKFLVATTHDETLFAERSLRAGATGYVNKEEPPERILDAIRAVLRGELYVSQRMKDLILRRMVAGESVEKNPMEDLSDRELQVFELIGRGLATKEIAARLDLSVKTIEAHREHIKSKLGLHCAADLTRQAVQWILEQ